MAKKTVSEARLDANRFGVLSRLADDLAHEIKNPLHAIVINLEVLRRKVEKNDAAAAMQRTEVIEQEVHRVHDLVESLLRLLRPRRVNAGPSSIAEALNSVLPLTALRARLAGIEYEQSAIPVDGYTDVPADAIRFAALALAEAALLSALPEKGKVTIQFQAGSDVFELIITPTGTRGWGKGDGAQALKMAHELLDPHGGQAQSNTGGSATIRLPFVVPALTKNSEYS